MTGCEILCMRSSRMTDVGRGACNGGAIGETGGIHESNLTSWVMLVGCDGGGGEGGGQGATCRGGN